jgi:Domain of unknown function (DUF4340)
MGARGTVILAFLIVLVGAAVWFEEVPKASPPSTDTLLGEPRVVDPNRPIRHLLDFEPVDIVAIELQRDGTTRTTTRSATTWSGSSKPGAINDFLQNLSDLQIVMDIPAGETDLRDYGLEPPVAVLRLQPRAQSQPLVLQIGNRNPSVTGVYVRIGNDGPVVLGGALVIWEFDKAFRALGPPDADE